MSFDIHCLEEKILQVMFFLIMKVSVDYINLYELTTRLKLTNFIANQI
jgi:hypothetical protein